MENRRTASRRTQERDPGKTVYIGNLNYQRDETGIQRLFTHHGKVRSVELIKDETTELSKGYAFVKMFRSEDALRAIKNLNGKVVDERTLKVSEALGPKVETKPIAPPLDEIKKEVKKVVTKREKNLAKKKENNINNKEQGLHVLFNYLNS